MSRPDKRVARFGAAYHPELAYDDIELAKMVETLRQMRPVIIRMGEVMRTMAERYRQASIQLGENIRRASLDPPLLDRIDDTLHSYDASRPDTSLERPYGWI